MAGRRRLLTGPVGPGSTFSVLATAAQAASAGRSCVLVLPTQSARDHARNELARRLGRCDPSTVFTFAGFARYLLGSRAYRLASPRERDAQLVTALSAAASPEHTLALRYRGFRGALLRVFEEVEQNSMEAGELSRRLRSARLDPDRRERLVQAYQGYRSGLHGQRLATRSDLIGTATRALLGKNRIAVPQSRLPQLVLVDGFMDLTLCQRAFLDALAGRLDEAGELVLTWPVPPALDPDSPPCSAFATVDRTRRELLATGFVEEQRQDARPPHISGAPLPDPRPPALQQLAQGLFRAEATPLAEVEGLRVLRAASLTDEVRCALGRARQWVPAEPGRRWREVLLIVPQLRRYRPALERVAAELAVPVRVRAGLPLASSPLVQAGLAYLRGVAARDLGALLAAAACPGLGLTPSDADQLARAARRRGLPTVSDLERWDELAAELGGAAGRFLARASRAAMGLVEAMSDDDTTRAGCRLLRQALERTLRPVALGELTRQLRRTTTEARLVALHAAASEVSARRELLALLLDLERLALPLPLAADDAPPGPLELLARIEEEVRASEHRPRDQRRDVLHVVDPREARAWEADLVFVLGLSERAFADPQAGHELFLPEGARRALSGRPKATAGRGRLPLRVMTAQDRAAEEQLLFYAAVTRARRTLWLSRPGFSASGNPLRPSRMLDEVAALFTPEAWAKAQVERAPRDLVEDDPERLLTLGEARRFAYRRATASLPAPTRTPSVPEEEPPAEPQLPRRTALAVALLRELWRDEAELTRASVALRRQSPGLDLPPGPERALDHVYSASELETYATCPFRHFVHYQLDVRRQDDLAQDGLDARRQGTVVHEALRKIVAEGAEPRAAFAEAFAAAARELDIGIEEDAFRRQAEEAIAAFAQDDARFRAATGLEPWGCEKAFGPRSPHGSLEIEAPDLGGSIRLQGAIDRVDVLPPEPAEAEPGADAEAPRQQGFVTDYKLGGREVDAAYLDGIYKGDKLQIPLYLLALERVFDLEPIGAGFAALGTRRRTGVVDPITGRAWGQTLGDSEGVRLHRIPLNVALEKTEQAVRRFVGGIASGIVDSSPSEASDCARCDARDVCRLEPHEAKRRARRGRPLPLERMQRWHAPTA